MTRLDKLIEYLVKLSKESYTGRIDIHWHEGCPCKLEENKVKKL
jgi:hypothetical protein